MSESRPVRTPLIQFFEDFRRGPLALLVWLLAVGGVAWIFSHRVQHFEFTGLARARQSEVSSAADGYLRSLNVDLYQNVEAGQIVAQLDDGMIMAQVEVLKANVERLRTELKAEDAKVRGQGNVRLSKAQADLANIRAAEDRNHLDALGLKTQVETDRIEEQRLGLEVGRMQKLLEARACSQQEFDTARLKHDEVARRIAENTTRLTQTESAWRDALRQRETYTGQMPQTTDIDIALEPIRASIHVQELSLEELSVKRNATLLRAPLSGQVVQVLCQAGQAVKPGEAILLIGERSTREVVGYMAEVAPTDVRENMTVEVARAAQPDQSVAAFVSRVSPAIELLPQHLWVDANHPRYGRPFVVSLSKLLPLVPGERMVIRASR